ncbi:MAG: LysR substrate-binding domain-containing protein [Granulosicoccus sp.]
MTALPTLKQFQYLVALSEELNFTRAAESCFVTQSTLSAGLKELENILGAQLVERDRQNVFLSVLGRQVTDRARSILTETQDLVTLAAASAEPMTGYLRLGVIPTIAPFLLPQSLKLLRTRYPKLRIGLREDTTARLLQRIGNGQLDFALIALPFDTGNFLVETVFDEELWLVGCKGDPEVKAKGMNHLPSTSDRLLLLEEGHCLRDQTLYACAAKNQNSLSGIEATSLLTMVQMIESGMGIGLIPDMAIRAGLTDSPELLVRALTKPRPKRTIALIARRSTSRLAEMHTLVDIARDANAVKKHKPKR